MLRYLRALRATDDERERTLPYVDPLRAGRHPFQTYLLLLCLVSALPYLVGRASAEAVELHLPHFLALSWGILLLIGSSLALIGSYWRWSYDTALTLERAGLSITGVDGLVYGLCVLGGRDIYAPLYGALALLGAYLIRTPIRVDRQDVKRRLEDGLAILGLILVIIGAALLAVSPASKVLVGAAIIVGFGLSRLRRAGDIGKIFARAREMNSPRVLREGET